MLQRSVPFKILKQKTYDIMLQNREKTVVMFLLWNEKPLFMTQFLSNRINDYVYKCVVMNFKLLNSRITIYLRKENS